MKLSNKILLGTVFFVLLIITGHYLSLYIKYKTGKYSSRTAKDTPAEPWEDNVPGAVKYIVVNRCSSLDIISSDTLHYMIGKEHTAFLKRETRNDTLFLDGTYMNIDTIYDKDKMLKIDTSYSSIASPVELFMTNNEKLISKNSQPNIILWGKYGEINVDLINSTLNFYLPDGGNDTVICKGLRKLQVHAILNSDIRLLQSCNANDLIIKLADHCSLNCANQVTINRAEIEYSDSSHIDMQGEQLKSTSFIYAKELAPLINTQGLIVDDASVDSGP